MLASTSSVDRTNTLYIILYFILYVIYEFFFYYAFKRNTLYNTLRWWKSQNFKLLFRINNILEYFDISMILIVNILTQCEGVMWEQINHETQKK